MQASLERVGLDASKAVARARSRSVSRVGRKRTRDAPAGGAEAMDVDGSQALEQKRIHSAKSRCSPLLPVLPPYRRKLHHGCDQGMLWVQDFIAASAIAATLAQPRGRIMILPMAHVCNAVSCDACAGQCPAGEH